MIVKICKEGKLFYNDKDITAKLPSALHYVCELEDDLTFKDVILLTQKHQDFLSTLLSPNPQDIKDLVQEGLNEPDEKSRDLWYIEIYWRSNLVNYSYNETPELYTYVGIQGIGDPTMEGQEYEKYALDLTPLNNIAHLPIKINNNMVLYDERKTSDDKFQFGKVLFEAKKDFSLFELLYGIFYELTFHGGPKKRDEAKNNLLVSIKEIEDGTAELVPWDVVKKNLKERLNKKNEKADT